MNREKMMWCLLIGVVVLLMPVASARATVVTSNLAVWLDAADADGNGVRGLGTGTTWANLAPSGNVHNTTLAAAGSGSVPTWVGDGSSGNPYRVQIRYASNNNGGYAIVGNSGGGSSMDTQTYSYEIWARRNGVGSDGGFGALIGHNHEADTDGSGNGTLWYRPAAWNSYPPVDQYYFDVEGGNPTVHTQLPNGTGVFSDVGYHQYVVTRAGDGTTDTAFYIDGVLQGTCQTTSQD
jgi:hypothetical protein